jgi:hypothetical protein
MENPIIGGTFSEVRSDVPGWRQVIRLRFAVLLFLLAVIPITGRAQTEDARRAGTEPIPEPAVPAILAAFDKYEVVAMPEAHGLKDLDDFILSLIRNPTFAAKVNDIEVECGNSLYQPILDRYISGEEVPFAEVRKVWRNTTQPMCGMSGFFEQFFPLVRAINQMLPPGKRLRVLAGDPPIDWDRIQSLEDWSKFADRDGSIASVMEKEVLSKHRKALMLFGTFHLMHGQGEIPRGSAGAQAVSIYEKDYPNVTFVISDLGPFYNGLPAVPGSRFATWLVPSLVRAKGTWLGALDLGHFVPPLVLIDRDCKLSSGFPKPQQRPMEELVDAFLYLGPPDLSLSEPMPGDIALDVDYRMELQRRKALSGFHGAAVSLKEADREIVNEAENPLYPVFKPPDPKLLTQDCLNRKSHSTTPQ